MPGELIALIEEVLQKQNGLDFTWQTNKEEKAEVLKLNSIACSPFAISLSFSFALSQMSPMKMRNLIYFIIINICVVVTVVVVVVVLGQFMVRCLTTKTIKLMTLSLPTWTSPRCSPRFLPSLCGNYVCVMFALLLHLLLKFASCGSFQFSALFKTFRDLKNVLGPTTHG